MNDVKFDRCDLDGLFNWNSLLDRLLSDKTGNIYEPAVRFEEDDEWYIINIDVSEMNKKSIYAGVKDNRTILITAEKNIKRIKTDSNKITEPDSFKRTFVIPHDADETDIAWKIKRNILKVYVGKIDNNPEKNISDFLSI